MNLIHIHAEQVFFYLIISSCNVKSQFMVIQVLEMWICMTTGGGGEGGEGKKVGHTHVAHTTHSVFS